MADVDQTTMKVQRLLTGPMGLRIEMAASGISVRFSDRSPRTDILIDPYGTNADGDPSSVVRILCPLLWQVDPSAELFEWVAREGSRYWFGHVSAENDVKAPGKLFLVMTHTLLGDYLDEGELSTAMYAVLRVADELDDELQKRFGGKRLPDLA